jgi:hypothetical protein
VKILDRLFAVLLLLGAAGHTAGTFVFYRWPTEIFVWSLGASLAAILLGVINLLRVNRPADTALAWTCLGGVLAWLALVIAFGAVEGNLLDPRVVMHAVAAIGLAAMSARTLMRARP